MQDGTLKASEFAAFVLQEICGFTAGIGTWQRGSAVGAEWARPGVAGEAIKPRHLWRGDFGDAFGDELAVRFVNHKVAIHEGNLRHLVSILGLDVAFPEILRFVHMAIGVDDFKCFPHMGLRFVYRLRMKSRDGTTGS